MYLRVKPKGNPTDAWSRHMAYARIEVEKNGLAKPYPFTPDPNKKLNQYDSYASPNDEFSVVFQTEDSDPDHQVYTLNAVKYHDADLYVAFPNFWYPTTSDRDDVQFAFPEMEFIGSVLSGSWRLASGCPVRANRATLRPPKG